MAIVQNDTKLNVTLNIIMDIKPYVTNQKKEDISYCSIPIFSYNKKAIENNCKKWEMFFRKDLP